MKFTTILFAALLLTFGASLEAQTSVTTTNQSGGTTTVSNLLTGIPQGVTMLGQDAYGVFRGFSLTNPISVGFVGLKNGSLYGGGIEANTVDTNSPVSMGFGVFAIETQTTSVNKLGKTVTSKQFGFYDATLNLSVSQVENIPIINQPLILRAFSGPFTRLNGGVLLGEQSGVSGDLNFQIGSNAYLDIGGGAVNCAGAAANGLASVMPMAHINFTAKW